MLPKCSALRVAALVGALASSAVMADNIGLDLEQPYAIGSIGFNDWVGDSHLGFGLGVGAPLSGIHVDKFGIDVETGFNYYGSESSAYYDVSSWGIYGLVKPKYQIQPKLSAYAKLGLGYERFTYERKGDDSSFSFSGSDGDTSILFGLGGEYVVSPQVTVGVDYTDYGKADTIAGVVKYAF